MLYSGAPKLLSIARRSLGCELSSESFSLDLSSRELMLITVTEMAQGLFSTGLSSSVSLTKFPRIPCYVFRVKKSDGRIDQGYPFGETVWQPS